MLNEEQIKKFNDDGYLVLDQLFTVEQCEKLKKECENIIESNSFVEEVKNIPTFSSQAMSEYFLTSGDKIRAFLEENYQSLQNEGSKRIFNKIGHALHAFNPVFKEITFDQKIQDSVRSLGFKKPVVCQSMYIFKQPYIGGEVKPHQDASYLYTNPLKECGVWIALEDCTVENGCLSFIPGSHKGELATRFIRNPNKEEFEAGKYLIYTKENVNYDDKNFVPAPVKAGSAIIIDGLVVHKSEKNTSSKSRHIYTFHVYDSENAEFSKENWMEQNNTTFLPLYSH